MRPLRLGERLTEEQHAVLLKRLRGKGARNKMARPMAEVESMERLRQRWLGNEPRYKESVA